MEYKGYNDYELIYMARENDASIRSLLYEKYTPIIRNISKEFYQKYNQYGYEYEDFLQEATYLFEKALVNYDESKRSMFYTFVILCIRRGMSTFCRNISNENKNKKSYWYIDIDKCNIPDEKNNINKLLDEYDINKMITDLILNLSIEYSTILELKINGFNYREIATLLSIPRSTAEYRIRKIRKEVGRYYCKGAI